MKALCIALKDECKSVRETTAGIIGRIGKPEAMFCLESLLGIVKKENEDPNVKSLAIWAIGRIGPDACARASKIIV